MNLLDTAIPHTFYLNREDMKFLHTSGAIKNENDIFLDTAIHYMMLGNDEFNDARIPQCVKEEKVIKDLIAKCHEVLFNYVLTRNPFYPHEDNNLFLTELRSILNTRLEADALGVSHTIMDFTFCKQPKIHLNFFKQGGVYLNLILVLDYLI